MADNEPTEPNTALWRWMLAVRVTNKELADATGLHSGYVSEIRRGKFAPSDRVKLKIEEATRTIEIERKLSTIAGVAAEVWIGELRDRVRAQGESALAEPEPEPKRPAKRKR